MPKVTEAHVEARRQQILDAAWACFARKGYHQTTMQDICQESGLSPGAIYRYFESKEAILKGINDRSQEMGRELVEQARSQMGGPLDTLEIIGQTMLSVFNDPAFETTARVNMEISPEQVRDDILRKGLRTELTFWRRVVAELLSQAKELGQLRAEVDPASLAALLICAFDGLRHYALIDYETFKPERLIELMRALVSEEALFDTDEVRRKMAGKQAALRPPLGARPSQRRRGRKEEAADAPVRR